MTVIYIGFIAVTINVVTATIRPFVKLVTIVGTACVFRFAAAKECN